MIYEYRCLGCDEKIEFPTSDALIHYRLKGCTEHLAPGQSGGAVHDSLFCDSHRGGKCGWEINVECGPLRRIWSFGIAWPKTERGH